MTRRAREGQSSIRLSRIVLEGIDCVVLSVPVLPDAAFLRHLTPAERDVAAALARGESNAQIARSRGTSARTVANQVASILRKASCPSRAGIAAMIGDSDRGGNRDDG